jgi:hypothetical protein
MGFDCIICGERDIWANESNTPSVCKDCARLKGKEALPTFPVLGLVMYPFPFTMAPVEITLNGNTKIGTFIQNTSSL